MMMHSFPPLNIVIKTPDGIDLLYTVVKMPLMTAVLRSTLPPTVLYCTKRTACSLASYIVIYFILGLTIADPLIAIISPSWMAHRRRYK